MVLMSCDAYHSVQQRFTEPSSVTRILGSPCVANIEYVCSMISPLST